MNGTAVLLIAGILIVCLLFSGQIVAFVQTNLPNWKDWIQDFISKFGFNPWGDNVTGTVGIGFKICYLDGTYEKVNEDGGLKPLSIFFNGKPVFMFIIDVYCRMIGTVGEWSTVASHTIDFCKKGNPAYVYFSYSKVNVTYSGSSWANNTIKLVSSYLIMMKDLEPKLKQYSFLSVEDWQMKVSATLAVNATINGSKEYVVSSPAANGIFFTYNGIVVIPYSIQTITEPLR